MPMRYKDSDYTRVERALRDAGLGPTIDAQVWATFEERGPWAALGQITGLKSVRDFVSTTKQADEFDALGTQFAQALRNAAQQAGGDKNSVVRWAQNIVAQASSRQGLSGATKEAKARDDFDAMMGGVSDHIVRTGGNQL